MKIEHEQECNRNPIYTPKYPEILTPKSLSRALDSKPDFFLLLHNGFNIPSFRREEFSSLLDSRGERQIHLISTSTILTKPPDPVGIEAGILQWFAERAALINTFQSITSIPSGLSCLPYFDFEEGGVEYKLLGSFSDTTEQGAFQYLTTNLQFAPEFSRNGDYASFFL